MLVDDVSKQAQEICFLLWREVTEELTIVVVGELSQDWYQSLPRHGECNRLIAAVAVRQRTNDQFLLAKPLDELGDAPGSAERLTNDPRIVSGSMDIGWPIESIVYFGFTNVPRVTKPTPSPSLVLNSLGR